ncbi:MAG: cytochrome c-type biogenesis CcmF C-terminal domain-containing protein, partial [Polyangiales bacterium]
QLFVCITTAFPLISEAVTGEKVTVGPAFYNRWMVPLGLTLFALMGVGPLLGWRKTSDSALRRAFRIPLVSMGIAATLHLGLGKAFGFPAIVESDPIYPGLLGTLLAKVSGVVPLVATSLSAFNVTVIVQEYARGIRSRIRTAKESFFTALFSLVARQRRRYGGYIVHSGIVVMFLGFIGGAYKVDQEYSLHQGESVDYQGYHITYMGPRRVDTDPAKMEIYIDLKIEKGGKTLGIMSPARFIYRRQQMPTSEVDIRKGLKEDLYIAPGTVNPESKVATIHVYVNPLENWIWIGAIILVLGAAVATWPDAALGEVGVGAYLRTAGATAASLVLGLLLALTPARATAAQQSGGSSQMAGNVEMKTPQERQLFSKLLCLCGGCDRLPLDTCVCETAQAVRAEFSARLAAGETVDALAAEYEASHGAASLNVPPSRGFLRSIWLVPVGLIGLGAVGAVVLVRKWTKKDDGKSASGSAKKGATDPKKKDDYDAKLDAELRDLDE